MNAISNLNVMNECQIQILKSLVYIQEIYTINTVANNFHQKEE